MSDAKQMLYGAMGGAVLTAVSVAASFVQFRLIVDALPQSEVGLWFLFLSVGGYLLFFDLGVSPTLGREISFCSGDLAVDEQIRNEKIGTLIRTCLGAFSGLALIVIVAGSLAGWAYLSTVTSPSMIVTVRNAWAIFVLGTSITIIGEVWLSALYGMGRVGTEKLVRSIGPILWLFFTILVLRLHLGISGLAFAWLLQTLAVRALALLALNNLNPVALRSGRFDFELISRLAVPSMKYAGTMLGGILILQTDNLVIASVLGTSEIPGYQAVAKLVTLMMSLSMMLVVSSVPFLSKAHARQDVIEIKQILHQNLRISLSIMATVGCFFAIFADRIISMWIGPDHFVGFGVIWILIAVMFLEGHHAAMAAATMSTGKLPFVIPALIAGALNIIASVLLAKRFGLLGVAAGTLCAQLLTNNWFVPLYTMRQFNINLYEHARTVLLPISKLLALLIALGFLLRVFTNSLADIPSLLLSGTILSTFGFAAFSIFLLSPGERGQLKSIVQRFGRMLLQQMPPS
jgi:O-antigen/teichoic acid export membrane protein